MVLVFDIGGTSTKFSLINESRQFIETDVIHYSGRELIDIHDLSILVINTIKKFVDFYQLKAVCISTCGVVEDDGSISGLSAILNYENFNWKKELQQFDFPVYIENDANCSLLAEQKYGVAVSNKNLMSLVLGTGIGGAVMIDGKILKGFSGEFGCMIDEINDDSIKTISSYSPRNTEILLNTHLSENKSLKDYMNDDYATDDFVKKIIDKMILTISKTIVNISFVNEIETIIIGGAISENKWFVDELRNKVMSLMKQLNITHKWKLESAKFKNDANLLGAYSLSEGGENDAY